jgi:hypothetical protein
VRAVCQREVEAVRLELARERTRRRGLEQEKERLEAMVIQATRTNGEEGGMLIDLGDYTSPRGVLSTEGGKFSEDAISYHDCNFLP